MTTTRTSMLAYALRDFDERPGLTEVSIPEPGPGEVRVRVAAGSVNPVDAASGAGFFRGMSEYRFPAVLGRDVAGTVDRVGDGVTSLRPGDEVFGMVKRGHIGDGTFAEFVVVPEGSYVVPRPDALSLADAGAIGLAAVTAVQCVDALGSAAGATVFVNGATGGVGAFAIQYAVAEGLTVIATARPGIEAEHVRALGAAEVIDWAAGDVVEAVRALRPGGVDGLVDLVSRGAGPFTATAALLAPDGTGVSTLSAAPAESDPAGPRLVNVHSAGDAGLLARIADLAVEGVLRVPLVSSLPFDRIDEAFALLSSGPLGKVGLTFPG